MMTSSDRRPAARTFLRVAVRIAAAGALAALGAGVMLGLPFEPVLEEPSLAAPGFVVLGAWFVIAAGWVVAGAFGSRWGRWPGPRPRSTPMRLVVGVFALVLLPTVAAIGAMLLASPTSNVGDLRFTQELAIPPLLEPEVTDDGELVFPLHVQHGQRTFIPGTTTDTLGVNGDYLGPTLRMRDGDRVRMEVTNAIDEVTTMHWHGMHLPAAADGGPHQLIHPGDTWTAEWTVDQPAATLWYHPHPHGRTGDQVERGLTGLIIVDDEHRNRLELPDSYGVDDIPLIVQDRRFDDDGNVTHRPSLSSLARLGDEILVNGTHDPYLEVEASRVRFRLLNGANERSFAFGFDDDRTFHQIASDGGLLPEAVETRRLQLSPGERAEIVVDFAPGDEVVLRSFPPDLGAPLSRRVGGADEFEVLRITADDDLSPAPDLPDRLTEITPLAPEHGDPDRTFELGDEIINGEQMDPQRVDHVVAAGATEVWDITNTDLDPHNFHVHDRHFQVLSVDGVTRDTISWEDTVYVPPGSTVRIAIEFGEHTDPALPYMFHCHLLTHEDGGMMGQFTVVEPREVEHAPTRIPTPGFDHPGS